MEEDSKPDTMIDKLVKVLYNNRFSVAIILIGVTIVALSKVTDAYRTIVDDLGLQKEYTLDQETERGKMSLQLIQKAENMLFWMNSYTGRIRHQAPKMEIESSWKKYHEALEVWNTNLPYFLIQLKDHYPRTSKSEYLETVIQPKFANTHKLLINLRYHSGSVFFDSMRNIHSHSIRWNSIEQKLDTINGRLTSLQRELYVIFDRR
jgi:hypothetical protein